MFEQETAGGMAWANDNKTLFYVTKDSLDRPFKVWRHVLGSKPTDDTLVFHEVTNLHLKSVYWTRMYPLHSAVHSSVHSTL